MVLGPVLSIVDTQISLSRCVHQHSVRELLPRSLKLSLVDLSRLSGCESELTCCMVSRIRDLISLSGTLVIN